MKMVKSKQGPATVQVKQLSLLGFRLLIYIQILLGTLSLMISTNSQGINGNLIVAGTNGGSGNNSTNSNNKTISISKSIVIEECKAFTYGISTYEFTSPLYPNNYPDNIDCVKLITAEPGHRIQIRIIESFQLEESPDCKYDYLEVRNGQFGYSTTLAKVCGNIPPTPILGQGHYMWLKFHSDGGINYGGFKALISMVPSSFFTQEVIECEEELHGQEGRFTSDDLMSTVPFIDLRATTCAWIIEASENKRISLKFEEYKLEKPNDCGHNFIEVYRTREDYDGRATQHGAEQGTKKFCGSTADSVKSIQNFLAIRFFAVGFKADNAKRPQFKANFTIYRELKKDIVPPEVCDPQTEFNCGDLTCISKELECNHKYNCDLRSDEEKCPVENVAGLTPDILVIGLVGCILIFGMCAGLIMNVYRKLKQDREELLELKRELKKSRESMPFTSNRFRLELESSGPSFSPSSQDSAESKITVIERKPVENFGPILPPTSTSPNNPPLYSGMGFTFPQNINGGPSPSSNTKLKDLINTVNTTLALITYSPPPSYPSIRPKFPPPAMEACTGTEEDKDLTTETNARTVEEDEEEIIIEVRDVACQTRPLPPPQTSRREIFSPTYQKQKQGGPSETSAALYELLPVQKRKIKRTELDTRRKSYPRSFSSASSETGTSLEHLDKFE